MSKDIKSKRRKFKSNEICLIINGIINDEHALEFLTSVCKSEWGHRYQKDEDDKLVEVALLLERLYVDTHLAFDYNECTGWTKNDLTIPMINICDLYNSREWRKLEDIELLELLTRLYFSVYSPDMTLCFASESDYKQLNKVLIYYYDKVLKNMINSHNEE